MSTKFHFSPSNNKDEQVLNNIDNIIKPDNKFIEINVDHGYDKETLPALVEKKKIFRIDVYPNENYDPNDLYTVTVKLIDTEKKSINFKYLGKTRALIEYNKIKNQLNDQN